MSRRQDGLTEHESAFAFKELRRGRRFGYHLMTNEHPLACYAANHPTDPAAWIADAETGRFRQVTADECDGIIRRNINHWMKEKNITTADVMASLDCSISTAENRIREPSTMDSGEVRSLCDLLGVNLDQLIYRKSTDPDQDAPMTPDKVKAIYSNLSEKHQKMISEMVWELFDGECAHREVHGLIDELDETISCWERSIEARQEP